MGAGLRLVWAGGFEQDPHCRKQPWGSLKYCHLWLEPPALARWNSPSQAEQGVKRAVCLTVTAKLRDSSVQAWLNTESGLSDLSPQRSHETMDYVNKARKFFFKVSDKVWNNPFVLKTKGEKELIHFGAEVWAVITEGQKGRVSPALLWTDRKCSFWRGWEKKRFLLVETGWVAETEKSAKQKSNVAESRAT